VNPVTDKDLEPAPAAKVIADVMFVFDFNFRGYGKIRVIVLSCAVVVNIGIDNIFFDTPVSSGVKETAILPVPASFVASFTKEKINDVIYIWLLESIVGIVNVKVPVADEPVSTQKEENCLFNE